MTEMEPMIVAVRAHATPGAKDGRSANKSTEPKARKRKNLDVPSGRLLVFDTETTTDHAQRLRFGVFQVLLDDRLDYAGIFYEPETLSANEVETLREYAAANGLWRGTREAFVREVFFKHGYDHGGQIVGFNLPFDLSRLAISIATSKGRNMRGGFSLKLAPEPWLPAVLVKHLNSRAAFIRFAAVARQVDGGSSRKKKLRTHARHGFFADVKTLASALLGKSHSLASLANALETDHRKMEADGHGQTLAPEYLDYAIADVQVTLECHRALRNLYAKHGLTDTPAHRIYSEASIGKAYLRQMEVAPWRKLQPDFPEDKLGIIMSAYFGGRAEVRIRRQIAHVLYCDFRSMYPTVCTLMDLWRFVIAKGITWSDCTAAAEAILAETDLDQLQEPEFWRQLPIMVQVMPGDDVFPVRAHYAESSRTIGLNRFTSGFPLWYTLADCIASKLLTGKAPKVVKAIRFEPMEAQDNLAPITIGGDDRFQIDPANDDFYKRVIELRGTVQAEEREASKAGNQSMADRLASYQQMLKLLANSTSYGIFAELNVQSHDSLVSVCCHGAEDHSFFMRTHSVEEPGTHFHPLIATLITGAARLMLAIGERVAADQGLGWAFCDTDSLALARPDDMDDAEFLARAQKVTEWFRDLSPYDDDAPLFKIEDENFRLANSCAEQKEHEPLYALAISAKRYVLFNLDKAGKPIIRKALAHGLGHLLPPYPEEDAPKDIPAPSIDLRKLGIQRWHYDLWYLIVEAVLAGNPNEIDLDRLPSMNSPAASRYAASSPMLLHWFDNFNQGKPNRNQVHAFNFMVSFQMSKTAIAKAVAEGHESIDRLAKGLPAAVAPYDDDRMQAAQNAFDRRTGKPVPIKFLATYRDALAQYHLHSEAKFLNGDGNETGVTERRHVQAVASEYIGKEANRWEEQFHLGEVPEAQIEYGWSNRGALRLMAVIKRAANKFGKSALAERAQLSRQQLYVILKGGTEQSRPATIRALTSGVRRLEWEQAERRRDDEAFLEKFESPIR